MEIKINTANLDKAFQDLPRSTRNKALRPALHEGAKVVQKAVIANVNTTTEEESTGVLAKNIVVHNFKMSHGRLRAGVQVRKGTVLLTKKDKNGPVLVATYGDELEYGKAGRHVPGSEKRRAKKFPLRLMW